MVSNSRTTRSSETCCTSLEISDQWLFGARSARAWQHFYFMSRPFEKGHFTLCKCSCRWIDATTLDTNHLNTFYKFFFTSTEIDFFGHRGIEPTTIYLKGTMVILVILLATINLLLIVITHISF